MTPKPKPAAPKLVPVDFVCIECPYGYRTQLPRQLVAAAKRGWARVHWRDDGCMIAAREMETA